MWSHYIWVLHWQLGGFSLRLCQPDVVDYFPVLYCFTILRRIWKYHSIYAWGNVASSAAERAENINNDVIFVVEHCFTCIYSVALLLCCCAAMWPPCDLLVTSVWPSYDFHVTCVCDCSCGESWRGGSSRRSLYGQWPSSGDTSMHGR